MGREISCGHLARLIKLWTNVIIIVVVALLTIGPNTGRIAVDAQRSLHHWKHDLQHRIRMYDGHKQVIENIIRSSIYNRNENIVLEARQPGRPFRIASNGNVRFSDLIIPSGALRLAPHVAHRTADIMVNRTRDYVHAKRTQLNHILTQLETIELELNDPRRQYIYKGTRDTLMPHYNTNTSQRILGTRRFAQVQYGQVFETNRTRLLRVNNTDVVRVLNDTYLWNNKLGVRDAQGRLFFEGRKTFWNTVFSNSLKSGCCDRLLPLHTSRMMLRSVPQDVLAPIFLWGGASSYQPYQQMTGGSIGLPAVIHQLSTPQLYNQPIELSPRPPMGPNELGLRPPPGLAENLIRLPNLISTHQLGHPEVLKTIVLENPSIIDEASLANSLIDNRLVLGIASQPNFAFDLAPNNYLLKYPLRNYTTQGGAPPIQHVSGTMILQAGGHFLAGLQALSVNRVEDFARFTHETIVRTNRPATIRGPVVFTALPTILGNRNNAAGGRGPQNVMILRAAQGLEVGQVNGMHIPQDIVLLPNKELLRQQMGTLSEGDLIRVRGGRNFANSFVCEYLRVSSLVNGMQMPDGVIPLHLNDVMSKVGLSNLWFVDGVRVNHVTIQAGYFDEINLRDVNGDAQSIIMRSLTVQQPDGTTIIRAPLRINNLNLVQIPGVGGGLLNRFRPQEVIELNARQSAYGSLLGRKRFVGHVEAGECTFSEINQVANWTQHLIRVDRPNTVQTVHTQLVFNNMPQQQQQQSFVNQSQLNIDHLRVEFQPDTSAHNYQRNWNFAPEFYLLHQALVKTRANYTGGRYRVLGGVNLINNNYRIINNNQQAGQLVNGIHLADVVRLDEPFRFADTFTMVGKVDVKSSLSAGRIQSNYPIDAMDLVQFDKYRIPILGNTRAPIRLNSLVLGQDNRASFVQCRLLNGLPLSEFLANIMSLTRPQEISSQLVFDVGAPVNFEAMVRTRSSLNGVKQFNQFAEALRSARYQFVDGLQCNSVVIKT